MMMSWCMPHCSIELCTHNSAMGFRNGQGIEQSYCAAPTSASQMNAATKRRHNPKSAGQQFHHEIK